MVHCKKAIFYDLYLSNSISVEHVYVPFLGQFAILKELIHDLQLPENVWFLKGVHLKHPCKNDPCRDVPEPWLIPLISSQNTTFLFIIYSWFGRTVKRVTKI